jgi:hypothetical protein
VQSRPLCPLRKDHLDRLRQPRRHSHGQRPPHATMCLRPNAGAARVAVPVAPPAWHVVMAQAKGALAVQSRAGGAQGRGGTALRWPAGRAISW